MDVERGVREAFAAEGVAIRAVEGRPGGPNNDKVTLTFPSGREFTFDSYSGGGMVVGFDARKALEGGGRG